MGKCVLNQKWWSDPQHKNWIRAYKGVKNVRIVAFVTKYNKTCVNQPLKNRQNEDLYDKCVA